MIKGPEFRILLVSLCLLQEQEKERKRGGKRKKKERKKGKERKGKERELADVRA